MPQPTGQVDSTSTIEKPLPSSWISNARLIACFALPTCPGSATDTRAAYWTPGSSDSISVTGQRVAGGLDVPPQRARRGLLAGQRGRGHLAAGHAVDPVVHEDRGEPLAAGRGVDDLRRPDGREVAVALVGEHDPVRPDALDARGHGRRTPVRGLDRVEPQVVVGEHRAADGPDEDRPSAQAHLLQHLGHEAVDDAVPAARAVAGGVGQQERAAVDRAPLGHRGAARHRVACRARLVRRAHEAPPPLVDQARSTASTTSSGVGTMPPIRPWW